MQSPPSSPVFPSVPLAAFPHLDTPMSPSLVSPSAPSMISGSSTSAADVLCGWLHKATTDTPTLSTGDRPKLRWFIYNEETGELEYYRNPKDLTRLGAMSIHDAAFLPDAVPGPESLYAMDVVTSKKTYRLYHAQKATLDYWRQALQKRRSTMQESLMCELETSDNNAVGNQTTSECDGESVVVKHRLQHRVYTDDEMPTPTPIAASSMHSTNPREPRGSTSVDLSPHLEVESRVHETNRYVGPHTESQMQGSLTDLSVRNFSIEARNTLRSIAIAFRTSTGFMSHASSSEGPDNGPLEGGPPVTTPPPLMSSRPSRHPPQALRSPLPKSPGGRHSSCSPTKTAPCEDCRQMRGRNQDLQDHLKAAGEQLESLKATLRLLVESKPDMLTAEESAVAGPLLGSDLAPKPAGNTSQNQSSPGVTPNRDLIDQNVQNRLLELELERERLDNEVQMREEVINDKDRQLMELRNQLEELHDNPFGEQEFRQEFAVMRHERNGYREQNQSLNAEVLNLRLLFSASVEHERELIDAIKKLHDVYTKSSLRLKQRVEELSRPQLDSGGRTLSEKDRLDLLADALDDEVGSGRPSVTKELHKVLLEASGELTDEYGFYVVRQELDSQQMIDLTALGPEVNISQYLEIPPIDHETEASITAKWERYLDESGLAVDEPGRPLRKTPELKQLLRQGCPVRLRTRIWKAIILCYVDTYRRENGGEKIYWNLVEQQTRSAGFSIERKQIELDLHRSLPENKHFNVSRSSAMGEDASDHKVAALKHVLLAFCEISESVGYCQGLDRIAATMLLNVDEETSFWGLQVIVRRLRSEQYYTASLRDAQIDQRVFKDLIASHVPAVSQRLQQMDVDISLFSFNWFLTLFVDGFHWTVFMKIWDSFLFEGDKVIFRYAIAVVIYLEPILMHVTDLPSMYKVLRNAGRYIKDHRRLTEIAFCSLRSFPKRRITQKRSHYGQIVDKEIAMLNEERKKRRQKSSGKEMFAKDSEDEDYPGADE